jgi:hypothetical protein
VATTIYIVCLATKLCIVCDKERPVCCSEGVYDDGTHDDPICTTCCRHYGYARWHGQSVAGGMYERCSDD